ncbi:MAG TPA: SDR family NAD(P)-dependent oxidoreductase [Longilinea sp.]|nr:SDR family NAD(P)-dependent oxidoreductase [Longilinea sp.]
MKADVAQRKVVLITGASYGIGKAIAVLLAARGFKVFGTSRKVSRASGENYQMLQLDVTSDQSVAACVAHVIEQAGRIDVLVNNAGVGMLGAIEETTLEEAQALFDANFFGVVRMVDAVLPGMRQRRNGLIINLGSLAAALPMPYHAFLSTSKAAVMAYSDALRLEVQSLNIQVATVAPGMVRTHLGERFAALKVPRSIPDYAALEKKVVQKMGQDSQKSMEPDVVAETVLRIIRSSSPASHYFVGREKWFMVLNRLLPVAAMENLIKQHWEMDGAPAGHSD